MDAQQAAGFAKGWIQAWNQRDLESVLSHYTEDVEFQSPLVIKLLGETSGTLRGKQKSAGVFPKGAGGFSRRHRDRTARRLPGSEQRAGSFPGERKKRRRGHGTERSGKGLP